MLAAPVYSGAPVPVAVLVGPTGVAVALPPAPDPPVVPLWTPELPAPDPPPEPPPEPPVPTAVLTAVPDEKMTVVRPDDGSITGVVETVGAVINGGITIAVEIVGEVTDGRTTGVEVGQKVVV